jgi:hypothetical protein
MAWPATYFKSKNNIADSIVMVIYASLIAAVKQRPMLFNGITGGILCAGSDAIAQQLEPTSSPQSPLAVDDARPYLAPSLQMINTSSFLDYHRVLSAGLIGVFTGGMVYPTAYARLDALILGVKFSAVLKKSVLEIATVGIFVNSISMTSRGFFQGEKDASQVIQHGKFPRRNHEKPRTIY